MNVPNIQCPKALKIAVFNQSINQSIKTDLYSADAVCRKQIDRPVVFDTKNVC